MHIDINIQIQEVEKPIQMVSVFNHWGSMLRYFQSQMWQHLQHWSMIGASLVVEEYLEAFGHMHGTMVCPWYQ